MQPRFVLVPPILRFVAPGIGPVEQPFLVFVLHTVLKHRYWRQPGGMHCRLGRLIRDSILTLDGPVWSIGADMHAALVECVGLLELDAAVAPFFLDLCEPILTAGAEFPKLPEQPKPEAPAVVAESPPPAPIAEGANGG